MKQILTRSLFLGSEKSGFGLLFIEKLVCFWSVFSKFWSVLIIGDTGTGLFFSPGYVCIMAICLRVCVYNGHVCKGDYCIVAMWLKV